MKGYNNSIHQCTYTLSISLPICNIRKNVGIIKSMLSQMILTLGLTIGTTIDGSSIHNYVQDDTKFSGIQFFLTPNSQDQKTEQKTITNKNWNWPFQNIEITSWYGPRDLDGFHYGIDFGATYDVPIMAIAEGTVVFAGWNIGNEVRIQHGNFTFVYGHLNRIDVQVGQEISTGQIIGLNGSTGFSTGPHLHLEIWNNGVPVDPYPILVDKI